MRGLRMTSVVAKIWRLGRTMHWLGRGALLGAIQKPNGQSQDGGEHDLRPLSRPQNPTVQLSCFLMRFLAQRGGEPRPQSGWQSANGPYDFLFAFAVRDQDGGGVDPVGGLLQPLPQ